MTKSKSQSKRVAVQKRKVQKRKVVVKPNLPCSDCTVTIADGGLSEFKFPKAGLINESTHCGNCNGTGLVPAE